MYAKIIVALVAFSVAGCAPAPVIFREDPFSGHRTHRLDNNRVATEYRSVELELNPTRMVPSAGYPAYWITAVYIGPRLLEMQPGDSLLMNLDGRVVHFVSREGSVGFRELFSDGRYSEIAAFQLTLDDVVEIAQARSVQVRVSGSRSHVNAVFTPVNHRNFRRFVDSFAPGLAENVK